MIEAIATGYSAGLEDPEGEEDDEDSAIVETTRNRALGRRWRHLSDERLRGKSARCPGASGSSTSRPTRRRPSRPS